MTRRRIRGQNEGSIRQRKNGTWEARYTAGVTPEGKQVQRSLYGRTRAQAADKLKRALAELPQGAVVLAEQGKLTLVEQAEAYLSQRQGDLSAGTVNKLNSYIVVLRQYPEGNVPLRTLKPAHLEQLYRSLAARYAPATVRHLSVFVKQALRRAVRHELIVRNPADVAELPRMRSERAGVQLEPEQLGAILREAQHHRLYPIFATIASLGLRHGEALGLQWGDIDFRDDSLKVQRAVVSHSGTPVVTTPKTHASYRTLYLPGELRAVLLEWRGRLAGDGLGTGPGDWVFPSTKGTPLSQHNVRRVWKAILAACELPEKTRIHDLRGAFLARLIESGADVRTTADLAGHSDPRMTLSVYAYSRAENRKKALLGSAAGVLPKAAKGSVRVKDEEAG